MSLFEEGRENFTPEELRIWDEYLDTHPEVREKSRVTGCASVLKRDILAWHLERERDIRALRAWAKRTQDDTFQRWIKTWNALTLIK